MDKVITPDLMRLIYEHCRLHWVEVHGYGSPLKIIAVDSTGHCNS